MKKGKKFHENRTEKKYHSKYDIETLYNIYVKDKINHISAIIDMLRIRNDEIIVVELKRFTPYQSLPPKSHITQAAFSSIIAEQVYNKPAFIIEMRYWRGVHIEISLTNKLRDQVQNIIANIRKMIREGMMPDPTPDIKKCKSCEYWRICLRA